MIDPQIGTTVQQGPAFINWQINIWDLGLLIVGMTVLYSRLTTLETKIQPIWEWWNSMQQSHHRDGVPRRRAGDHVELV